MGNNNRYGIVRDMDINNSSGSALFNGSPVYGFLSDFQFGGENLVSSDDRTFDNPSRFTADDGGNLGSNWKRRTPELNWVGIEKSILKISWGWTGGGTYDTAGSLLSNGSLVMTPSRFFQIARSGRPIYFRDEYIIPSLIDGDTGLESGYYNSTSELTGSAYALGSSYYNKYGVPIVIKTPSTKMRRSNESYIEMTWTAWEHPED